MRYNTIIRDEKNACEIASRLIIANMFFKVTPLPSVGYDFQVKHVEAHVLDKIVKDVKGTERYRGDPVTYPMSNEERSHRGGFLQ